MELTRGGRNKVIKNAQNNVSKDKDKKLIALSIKKENFCLILVPNGPRQKNEEINITW